MTKTVKKKFKITDMHCSSCALSIELDLEETEGVERAKASYATCICEVEFNQAKVSDKKIVEVIQKTGYSALPLES